MDIPNNTLVDYYYAKEGNEDVAQLMKAIYLSFDLLQDLATKLGWTPTELINAAEMARRRGWIRIVYSSDSETLQCQVTELGKRQFSVAIH